MKRKADPVHRFQSSYLKNVLEIGTFEQTVADISATITHRFPTAQAIAFRGSSGALIAMSVCVKNKLHPMMVRKPDGNHSGDKVEGAFCNDYVIVDDLVASGATVRSITQTIEEVFCDWRNGAKHYSDH